MKRLTIFLLLFLFNPFTQAQQIEHKHQLISDYVQSELGFEVVHTEFSNPEGIYTNINRFGIELIETLSSSDDVQIQEVHIRTQRSLELNCIAYFYSINEEVQLGLENCSIWNNKKSRHPYSLGGDRFL